jgi:hypothetical protein
VTVPPEEIPIKRNPIKQSEIPVPGEIVRHDNGVIHEYNPAECDPCMHITDVILEGQ